MKKIYEKPKVIKMNEETVIEYLKSQRTQTVCAIEGCGKETVISIHPYCEEHHEQFVEEKFRKPVKDEP